LKSLRDFFAKKSLKKKTDKSKFEAHVWAGGFGAEFFVFDREAYLCTSEGENGKNKQKI